MRYSIKVLLVMSLITACKAGSGVTASEEPAMPSRIPTASAGPPVIVYRTRLDVGDAVPIQLSPDGKEVASYPYPRDLRSDDGPPLPTPLGGGYLLDNRGIGINTVFLKMGYAEYVALESPPSVDELIAAIGFRDPFEEMYDCGSRYAYTDLVKELETIVAGGLLNSRCRRVK